MLRPTLMVAAMAAAFPAFADTDLDAIRSELAQLKAHYETRLQALEARLKDAEAAPPPARTPDPVGAAATDNRFNPAVSLILQGRYAHLGSDSQRLTGFLSSDPEAQASRGFSLNGTELVMSSNIDPYFRGYFALALEDDTAAVEEAWAQTTALGHGVSVKAGRFRSGLGYQNEKHPHAWDFADNTLMYRALFGEGYANDGLQVKWVAPTDLYMELGAEAGRGAEFPGTDRNGNGAGSVSLFGHLGGDVGTSHSWRGGLAYLRARPQDREAPLLDRNGVDTTTRFSGQSGTWIADFVWKWAPEGNATTRNFTFASEFFVRRERGTLSCDANIDLDGACLVDSEGDYRARQSGFYAQGVYQFMPRWRIGYRYDQLNTGSVDFGANASALNNPDYRPRRHSLMVDYSPSEFSRLRFQLSEDASLQGSRDTQGYVQYIHSLGSHGAHSF